MTMDMCIIRASDFVRLTAEGETDLGRSRQMLSKVAAECVLRGIDCVLLDVRGAPGSLSLVDLYELAQSFQEMGFRREHRVAILHTKGAGERAKFFATASVNRGWHVQEFDSFERVFEWFSSEQVVGEGAGGGGNGDVGTGEAPGMRGSVGGVG